ncbi:MAG: hypothetical protein QM740_21375 [Acidovorax sp.]
MHTAIGRKISSQLFHCYVLLLYLHGSVTLLNARIGFFVLALLLAVSQSGCLNTNAPFDTSTRDVGPFVGRADSTYWELCIQPKDEKTECSIAIMHEYREPSHHGIRLKFAKIGSSAKAETYELKVDLLPVHFTNVQETVTRRWMWQMQTHEKYWSLGVVERQAGDLFVGFMADCNESVKTIAWPDQPCNGTKMTSSQAYAAVWALGKSIPPYLRFNLRQISTADGVRRYRAD